MIKGPLGEYFETGCEGVYFSIQDENFIDQNGMFSHEGLHLLKNGDSLAIYWQGHILWNGELKLLNTSQAAAHPYLKQYVKSVTYSTGLTRTQLSFAGRWVHYIPANVDLGLWFQVFMGVGEKFTGELTKKGEPTILALV